MDRLPLRNRQAGIGQPGGAADQHQRKQHQHHYIEPAAQQGPIVEIAVAGYVLVKGMAWLRRRLLAWHAEALPPATV